MITIKVNGPAYRGAPIPAFNPVKINESAFEDELRGKEWSATIDDYGNCLVIWMSQDSEYRTDAFDAEIIRAFEANGAKSGTEIQVRFGIRDKGWNAICLGDCECYSLFVR